MNLYRNQNPSPSTNPKMLVQAQTPMKALFTAAVFLFLAAMPTDLLAKAYFYGETELVTKSTAIAIIEISAPQEVEQQGKPFTYRQRAAAQVVQVIKGDIPEAITLYGNETFICAQCNLAAGRYLAFLSKDGDLWIGANWQLSLRPIKDDQIEWYVKPEERFTMQFQPAEAVLQKVRKILQTASAAAGKVNANAND